VRAGVLMRALFLAYVLIIAGGLVYFAALGLAAQ
jgi:hypothetical protein